MRDKNTGTVGALIDLDLDSFKVEVLKRPVGECLSLKNLITLAYNRLVEASNELTEKAVAEGKQNDPEIKETLQGLNIQMFKAEQKVLFLKDRIQDLLIH